MRAFMQPCITGKKRGKTKGNRQAQVSCRRNLPLSNRPSNPTRAHTRGGEKQALLLLCTKHETTAGTMPHLRYGIYPQARLPRCLRWGFYKNTVRRTAVMGDRTCSTAAGNACRSHSGRHNGQRKKDAQTAAPTLTDSHAHQYVQALCPKQTIFTHLSVARTTLSCLPAVKILRPT